MKIFEELKFLVEAEEIKTRDLKADYARAKREGLLPPKKIQEAFLNKISLTSPYIYYIYRYRTHYIKSNDLQTAGVLPSGGVIQFYYNEGFINGLSDEELVFLMEHELEHVVRSHSEVYQRLKVFAGVTEEQGGDNTAHEVFNLAADSRINADLLGINVEGKQEKDGRLTHLPHKMIGGGWVFNEGPKEFISRTAHEALSMIIPLEERHKIPTNVTWENIGNFGFKPEIIEVAKKIREEHVQFYEVKIEETDESGALTGVVKTEKIPVSSFEEAFGTEKNEKTTNKIKFEDSHSTDDYFMWGWNNRKYYEKFKKQDQSKQEQEQDKNWTPKIGMPVNHPDRTIGKITAINPDGSIETVEITKEEADSLYQKMFSSKMSFRSNRHNFNRKDDSKPKDEWTVTF